MEARGTGGYRDEITQRIGRDAHVGARQVETAEKDWGVELRDVDGRHPVRAGRHVGGPIWVVQRARDDDVPGLTRKRKARDDARRERQAAERVEALLDLSAIEQPIAIRVGVVRAGADGELNVVRQPVGVAVRLEARSEYEARGQIQRLSSARSRSEGVAYHPGGGVEHGEVVLLPVGQEELEVTAIVAHVSQHDGSEDVRRFDGNEVVAPLGHRQCFEARAHDPHVQYRARRVVGLHGDEGEVESELSDVRAHPEHEAFAEREVDRGRRQVHGHAAQHQRSVVDRADRQRRDAVIRDGEELGNRGKAPRDHHTAQVVVADQLEAGHGVRRQASAGEHQLDRRRWAGVADDDQRVLEGADRRWVEAQRHDGGRVYRERGPRDHARDDLDVLGAGGERHRADRHGQLAIARQHDVDRVDRVAGAVHGRVREGHRLTGHDVVPSHPHAHRRGGRLQLVADAVSTLGRFEVLPVDPELDRERPVALPVGADGCAQQVLVRRSECEVPIGIVACTHDVIGRVDVPTSGEVRIVQTERVGDLVADGVRHVLSERCARFPGCVDPDGEPANVGDPSIEAYRQCPLLCRTAYVVAPDRGFQETELVEVGRSVEARAKLLPFHRHVCGP